VGAGTLAAGDPVTLTLTGALELAPTTLVIGFSELGVPFKGGTLVPFPDVLLPGLTTDAGGALVLGGTWPAGVPAGFSFYFQDWVVDPVGVAGLAASNGLAGTAP
jgi:hypothetical protein